MLGSQALDQPAPANHHQLRHLFGASQLAQSICHTVETTLVAARGLEKVIGNSTLAAEAIGMSVVTEREEGRGRGRPGEMYGSGSGAEIIAAAPEAGAGAGIEAQLPNGGEFPRPLVRGRGKTRMGIDAGERGLAPQTAPRPMIRSVGEGGNEKTTTANGVRVKRESDGSGKKGRRRRRKRRKRRGPLLKAHRNGANTVSSQRLSEY
ncbi:hypothetical protein DFH06DRAFT_479267 [Mycena polygramma]|nr:hypothetical protein DFH06DRAFT_479267 [Mycena polygramma]